MSGSDEGGKKLHEALRLMTRALVLIDEDGGASLIGAQLDLARARLAEELSNSDAPQPYLETKDFP